MVWHEPVNKHAVNSWKDSGHGKTPVQGKTYSLCSGPMQKRESRRRCAPGLTLHVVIVSFASRETLKIVYSASLRACEFF